MVRLFVSMTHPKVTLSVPHEQSPSRSFLMDTGSRRCGAEDIVNRVEEGTANSLAVCEAVGAWGILWV